MSGHSKWSTIKRKKAAADARRGAVFTRLAREITIAAREGGGDPDVNFALRLTIDKAKAANMPKENIERSIRRGTGEDKEGVEFVQTIYEGYAPSGVGLLIEVITDNRNRTVAELRHILDKMGGNLAETGSVSWQFKRAAYFALETEGMDQDKIFDCAVEAGADDVLLGEEAEIIGPVESYKRISDCLREAGYKPYESGLRMLPNTTIELDVEPTLKVMRLIEALEDLDDVKEVFSNLHVSDEAVAELEAA